MPMNEYLCDAQDGGCGHQFEEIQSFTDEDLKKCPQCKKNKLRRLFGIPSLIFKGSGWTPKESGGNQMSTEA